MKSRILALMLAGAVAASGCAPEAGQVTAKHYDAAYMTTTTSCVWTSKGCSMVVIPMYVPESWVLSLRDADDEGDRDVAQANWTRCPVGSRYPECAESSQ